MAENGYVKSLIILQMLANEVIFFILKQVGNALISLQLNALPLWFVLSAGVHTQTQGETVTRQRQ